MIIRPVLMHRIRGRHTEGGVYYGRGIELDDDFEIHHRACCFPSLKIDYPLWRERLTSGLTSRRLFSKLDSWSGNEPIVPNVPVIKFKPIVSTGPVNPATLSKISN